MKKIVKIIVFLIVLVVVIGIYFLVAKEKEPKIIPLSEPLSDQEIILILEKNEDSLNYMRKYPDFLIGEKTLLTEKDILEGQEGEIFKEVYQDLVLENNRYLKVDLMNRAGKRGLIAVLDIKNEKVLKAYEIILIEAGVGVPGVEVEFED